MEHADISPPATHLESSGQSPLSNSLEHANTLSEAPAAFDAVQWLAEFEAVGGGWVLRDHLSLMWQIDGRPAADQRKAHWMISNLHFADRGELIAHLKTLQPGEANHG